jgi:hypothetical protein
MAEEEKEGHREDAQSVGHGGAQCDEFAASFDVSTLTTACTRQAVIDVDGHSYLAGSSDSDEDEVEPPVVVKFVLAEGKGSPVQSSDTVYYKAVWRADDGQLLRAREHRERKREKTLVMREQRLGLAELERVVLRTMKRGEVSFASIPWDLYAAHADEEEEEGPCPACYVRLEVNRIKRVAASVSKTPPDFACLMA